MDRLLAFLCSDEVQIKKKCILKAKSGAWLVRIEVQIQFQGCLASQAGSREFVWVLNWQLPSSSAAGWTARSQSNVVFLALSLLRCVQKTGGPEESVDLAAEAGSEMSFSLALIFKHCTIARPFRQLALRGLMSSTTSCHAPM